MLNQTKAYLTFLALIIGFTVEAQIKEKGKNNPVFEGWYADPEGIIFENQYWIYPTFSATRCSSDL
jgi:hypothetical protein